MLETLGVWDACKDEAQPVSDIELTDSSLESGLRPVLMTYRNAIEAGEPASWIVPAARLEHALQDAVRTPFKTPGMHCQKAFTVETISTQPDRMTATAAGAAGGAKRSVTATLLVGADGGRSRIRDLAGIKVTGWKYRQTGIVTQVTLSRPHRGVATQHFLPDGPFAILPLPGNRACITWTEDAQRAGEILAMGDAQFLGEVQRRFGGRLGDVTLFGERQSWPLSMHLAREITGERLALVGDAARGVHPIAGQGLNLGLRDVAALVDVISDAASIGLDFGAADVLTRYARWRRFDNVISTLTFDALNRLFSNDNALVRAVRGFGLGVIDQLPIVKERLVSQAAGLSGSVPTLMQAPPMMQRQRPSLLPKPTAADAR